MDTVFWICVEILKVGSSILGISYQALSAWIFVIIHPSTTLYLWYLHKKEKRKEYNMRFLKIIIDLLSIVICNIWIGNFLYPELWVLCFYGFIDSR